MTSPEARVSYYAEQVSDKGLVSLPFGISGADIEPIFTSFKDVLSLTFDEPGEVGGHVVAAMNTVFPHRVRDSASFIVQRRVGQINPYEVNVASATENKDTVHFTPLAFDHARAYFAARGGMPIDLKRLLDRCMNLYREARETIRPVFADMGVEDQFIAPKGHEAQDVHLLRILRYLPTTNFNTGSNQFAELHFDRSKFTTALWEDLPGLVGAPSNNAVGDPDMTVEQFDETIARAHATPIAHQSGKLKLFAGAGYNHLPQTTRDASGNWQPLLHGVQDTQPGQERWAVVMFINDHAMRQHVSVADSKTECDLTGVRQELEDRQRRYGGVLPD